MDHRIILVLRLLRREYQSLPWLFLFFFSFSGYWKCVSSPKRISILLNRQYFREACTSATLAMEDTVENRSLAFKGKAIMSHYSHSQTFNRSPLPTKASTKPAIHLPTQYGPNSLFKQIKIKRIIIIKGLLR